MSNDLIRLAMERAVRRFGERGDDIFNAAGFSKAMMDLAGLRGVIDGHLVRAMLAGRADVIPHGDAHFTLVRR